MFVPPLILHFSAKSAKYVLCFVVDLQKIKRPDSQLQSLRQLRLQVQAESKECNRLHSNGRDGSCLRMRVLP